MKKDVPIPFSPEDMARRRKRSIITALCLLALIVLFFVTTIVRMRAGILDRTL